MKHNLTELKCNSNKSNDKKQEINVIGENNEGNNN